MALAGQKQMSNEPDLLAVARKANAFFVIPGGVERLLKPISGCAPALASPYQEIAEAFSANIRSVVFTAGLPYMFALEASHSRRYQLFECAAELEAVLTSTTVDADGTSAHSQQVRIDADRRIRELTESPAGRASLNHEACCVLLRLCDSEEVREAASQLLLQALVLTWGAFEVVARDVFKEYLNLRPDAYARLASDPEVKKRFELTRIPMQRVADLGFDLSRKLGELLAEQHDLADLGTIKAAVLALFPTDERLRGALDKRELWILFQQRHLIVHRRAVIDRRYVEATGENQDVGARLLVAPRQVTGHIGVTVEATSALLSAAAAG